MNIYLLENHRSFYMFFIFYFFSRNTAFLFIHVFIHLHYAIKPRERAQTAGHKSFTGTGTRAAFNILTLII